MVGPVLSIQMDDRKPVPLSYESPNDSGPSFGSWLYALFFASFGAFLVIVSFREWLIGEMVDTEAGIGFGIGLFVFCFGAFGLCLNIRYRARIRASNRHELTCRRSGPD